MNPRDKVEAERRRLRKLADGMRARYGTDEHPNEEEAEEFARRIGEFLCSTDPELLWPEGVDFLADGSLFGILRTPEEWAFEERVTRKDTDPPRQEPTGVEETEEIMAERALERELLRRKEEGFLYQELCADLAPGEKRPTPEEVRAELERRRALPETQEDGSQDGYFVVEYDAPDAKGEGAA